MKKYTFRILSLSLILVVGLVAIVAPEFSAEALSFLGLAGAAQGGLTLSAFQGVSTFKNANDLDPTLITRDVSQKITTRRANDVPLDSILRAIGQKEKAHSFKVEYLEHTYRPFSDTVATQNSGNTSSEDIAVTTGDLWAVDDLIRVPSVTPSGGDELILLVTAKSGATLTVTAVNNTSNNVPTVAASTTIYKMGNAKSEKDAQTTIIASNPTTLFNYCQIFMSQLEQTVYDKIAKKEGGFSYKHYVDEVIFNYKSDLVQALMFGYKSKITSGGEDTYTTDGIYHKIQNDITFGTGASAVDPSLADIFTLGEAVFAGKNSSSKKLMLAGKKVVSGLAKIDKYQRDLSARDKEIIHGVKVTELTTPYGDIMVKYDPMMDIAGKQNEAIILDLEHVIKHELKPLEATPLDLDRTGSRRVVNAMRWDEACCATLRYAGSTGVHAKWIPDPTT